MRPVLFQSAQIGDIELAHRVVLAPMTRCRANDSGVHTDLAMEYYRQRACVPGTLLISEPSYVFHFAEGVSPHAPGVYTTEQIAGWKRVADAVHEKGSYIFMQLWACGRAAKLEYFRDRYPDYQYVSASDIPMANKQEKPRPLTKPEIQQYVEAFAQAARNAVHHAGFDGVEIHGGNGYLIDQFTQDVSNRRDDEYGGSTENRTRFALEVVDSVCEAIGESKTALRVSPWNARQDMRMVDPIPTFRYLISQLAANRSNLAYLHVVEGSSRRGDSNDFIRDLWSPRPLISAGRYTRAKALEVAESTGQLIAFGRPFISNPDLPLRLRDDIPLTKWDPDTFDTPEDPHGYIDYPFANARKE
ncbi:NADH:flavin oxidoreductase/NADH oxidase [Lentinus tigrinus ALCF2SS1-7]|uniref:NADH:flavin oxidoreductase/NADH oxidase n=1 Tax=Lentinus tigrinus ALCF2SS1-7 TaxID=1328758 RepID=UPI001166002F|nr:NADH:flavin oxidoreductase/NADH oxidase [Lentinus tigrinus ALCF2SS1-7]